MFRKKATNLFIILTVICFYVRSQNCLEFDSVSVLPIDTVHFSIKTYDKKNKSCQGFFTQKLINNKRVFDGHYKKKHNDIIIEEGEYSNGSRVGYLYYYHDNGKIKNMTFYINDSIWNEWNFYSNGQLESFGQIKLGSQNGEWCFYEESGILKEKGSFIVTHVTDDNFKKLTQLLKVNVLGRTTSLKQGTWISFSSNNLPPVTKKYLQGVEIKTG